MSTFLVFLILQIADFATTLLFLHRGVAEANPLVGALIRAFGQPMFAVLSVKLAGCLLAAYALYSHRMRLLNRANIFFALCVCWNLIAITVACY